jgi:methionyl-tRNA formyltransferase
VTQARIVLFGDPQGVPQVRAALGDTARVVALVQASTRPGQSNEMTAIADDLQVPLMMQPSAMSEDHADFVDRVAACEPDFIVVNSYSMILRPQLLATAGKMAVNVHGGLLPQYRGANVTEWALIGEEAESGVTVHVMDAGIDTGPILGQKKVPLHFTDTWVDARARINDVTEQLLADLLPRLFANDVLPQPQGEGRHWRRRKAEDGAFSWRWPLRRIYNLVRALVAPHPGAQPDVPAVAPIAAWTSLPTLTHRKFEALGAWEGGGMMLNPRHGSTAKDRESANARFDFDLTSREGKSLGEVALFPDYRANKARVKLNGDVAGAAAVTAVFCETELGISEIAVEY